MLKVSVILPALNAADRLPRLLTSLQAEPDCELQGILIDSESEDGTVEIARGYGWHVLSISREDFSHGRARNLAVHHAGHDILVFLTQDVLPQDDQFLHRLTAPIRAGQAEAAMARQIAGPDASPLEVFARRYNYPSEGTIRTEESARQGQGMGYFCSNAAFAVDRRTFTGLGGFPEDVVVNEDMLFCRRLLH